MDFSHTKIQTFNDCPKKFKHYYINRISLRKRPNYFILGGAVHKFIEIFYGTKDIKLASKQVESEFKEVDRTLLNREEIHQLEVDKNIALGISKAYPKFYKADFDEFETFLTEKKFKFKLPKFYDSQTDDHHYIGEIDCMMKDHAGDWWILETKTAAPQTVSADFFTRVKIDSQVMGYMYGAKDILGFFPRGVIYNVIKKPAIRLKKGESLSAFQQRIYHEYTKFAQEKNYFTREQLVMDGKRLEEWLKDTTHTTFHIADRMSNKSRWPMNTGNCQAKFGSCQYLPACTDRKYNKLIYSKQKR